MKNAEAAREQKLGRLGEHEDFRGATDGAQTPLEAGIGHEPFKLAEHLFTGPFAIETTQVRANQPPVVWAIVAKGGQAWAPHFRIVDIGTSPDEGLRIAEHPRRSEWTAADRGKSLGVYLFYAPRSKVSAAERERIAADLRAQYDPPRGIVA